MHLEIYLNESEEVRTGLDGSKRLRYAKLVSILRSLSSTELMFYMSLDYFLGSEGIHHKPLVKAMLGFSLASSCIQQGVCGRATGGAGHFNIFWSYLFRFVYDRPAKVANGRHGRPSGWPSGLGGNVRIRSAFALLSLRRIQRNKTRRKNGRYLYYVHVERAVLAGSCIAERTTSRTRAPIALHFTEP